MFEWVVAGPGKLALKFEDVVTSFRIDLEDILFSDEDAVKQIVAGMVTHLSEQDRIRATHEELEDFWWDYIEKDG